MSRAARSSASGPVNPPRYPMSSDPTDSASKKISTTNPSDMDGDVIEFMTAVDDYKRVNSRPFPTWSEVLQIVKELGYQKAS